MAHHAAYGPELTRRRFFGLGLGLAGSLAISGIAPREVLAVDYHRLTYDASMVRPFSGGLYYQGPYDLFMGGNGMQILADAMPTATEGGRLYQQADCDKADHPGYVVSGDDLPTIRPGQAFGNGPGGATLSATAPEWRTGSSGVVSWQGSVVRGLLTLGFMNRYTTILRYDVYGPRGVHTRITVDQSATADDGRAASDVVIDNRYTQWRLPTFDCTALLAAGGPGTWTVVCTGSNGDTHDLGWCLYGVSNAAGTGSAAASRNAIITGTVKETLLNSGEQTVAAFPREVTPNGSGKVCFIVNGGEGYEADTMDLIVDDDGATRYLPFGSPGTYTVDSTTVTSAATITRNELNASDAWNPASTASPNHSQTAPAGLVNYYNRFTFGLGDFEGLSSMPVRGVRKYMCYRSDGINAFDTFGSMLLLIEVPAARETPSVTTTLTLHGCDALPASKTGPTTFSYRLEALDGAPMPKGVTIEDDGSATLTATFAAGSASGATVTTPLGTFSFPYAGTYRYRVRQTGMDDGRFVDYDGTPSRMLTFTVTYDQDGNAYDVRQSWETEGGGASSNAFADAYSEGTLSFGKEFHGIWAPSRPLAGATFRLWGDEGCTKALTDYAGDALRATSDAAGKVSFSGAPVGDWFCREDGTLPDMLPNMVAYRAHVGVGGAGSRLSESGRVVATVPDTIRPGFSYVEKRTVTTW